MSVTVTVKEHEAVLFDASVAVTSSEVVPISNASGRNAGNNSTALFELSVVVTDSADDSTCLLSPGVVLKVWLAGQVMAGGCRSRTVTLNEHVALLP